MRLKPKTIILLASAIIVLLTPVIIFYSRAPVLIVGDEAFFPFYGKTRIRQESWAAAFALFRPVRTVTVTDDAGEDILPFAIAEVSSRPYCVLLPLRFARSARIYRELNPDIPIIILEGRYSEDNNPALSILGSASDYFIYKTDVNADFFTAGLAAAFLEAKARQPEVNIEENPTPPVQIPKKIAIFLESGIRRQGREAFLQAVNTQDPPPQTTFYTAFSQFSQSSDLACAVISGVGVEFFENNSEIPVILFTWLAPSFLPDETVLVLNDSPWAQAAEAVRMADEDVRQGAIPSKLIFLNSKIIDRKSLLKMRE